MVDIKWEDWFWLENSDWANQRKNGIAPARTGVSLHQL
jgi:hypothetical protein